MSVDQYRRDVDRYQKEIARLQLEKSRESAKVAAEKKRANDAVAAASRTKILSSAQSKLREAERYEAASVTAQRKVADIEAKIAREQGRLNDSHRRLAEAERQQEKRSESERKSAETKRRREEQEHQRALSSIRGKLSSHDRLHDLTRHTLQKLQQLPERITVLFLASNPIDQPQLRLDEEARLIGEMIRKSEHRDAVRLESRWAMRPMDVLQAVNECRPHIVHFSGHGSNEDEIVFQDAAGNTKLVSKEAIVQTMMAGSDEIQLVFFNTCYSRNQAEAVVANVPAAIGMNTSIGDEAARVFASQFYSAIGFGHSIGRAFGQAKAALMLEGIAEDDTPELFVATGLNADELFLVKPSAS